MYKYAIILALFINTMYGQTNIGVGILPTRARLEVHGVAGVGNTSAIFGGDGAGISFQRNWPAIGFNQYRDAATGYGIRIGTGYSAIQHFDPASGIMSLDMNSTSGTANSTIANPYNRAFSIFPSGTVSFGTSNVNTPLVVDNSSVLFKGTQYDSYLKSSNFYDMSLQPGKSGGKTVLNDIPGGNVSFGGGSAGGPVVTINTSTEFAASVALTVHHQVEGYGLLLIETGHFNNWEWYLSADNPSWIGLKYNTLLIADFNPTNGVYSYVSDSRLKNTITPLTPVMKKVMQLRPVNYRMINDPAKKLDAGFIAQEVKKIFPETVSVLYDNSIYNKGWKDTHMISYNDFYVIAVKAIQEQETEINNLLKELEQLESIMEKKNKKTR